MSDDSIKAVNTIRTILNTVQSHHGIVIDVFGQYKRRDIIIAVFALSRLQQASHYYEFRRPDEGQKEEMHQQNKIPNDFHNILRDEPHLVKDLAHYSIYANAAYGWRMELAFHQRLHFGGNVQALLRRTGISHDDILTAQWESKAHRPGYFCVRDQKQKSIVTCIRGTWNAHDLLTDLCCTPDHFDVDSEGVEQPNLSNQGAHKVAGHHGMLQAARLIQEEVEPILRKEIQNMSSDYSLVLVGHSMGGGVAALLGTLLERSFPQRKVIVYTYGAPCVASIHTKLCRNIVSVIMDGDPFSCISIGHVADVSVALSQLCEDPHLRNQILLRTNAPVKDMEFEDLQWCFETMEQLRISMKSEKLFPPGRIILMTENKEHTDHSALNGRYPSIREVSQDFFRDLIIGARMFDLSRHLPSVYEAWLGRLEEAADNSMESQ